MIWKIGNLKTEADTSWKSSFNGSKAIKIDVRIAMRVQQIKSQPEQHVKV